MDARRSAADFHSLGASFLGDMLGFGVSAVALGAVSASWSGVAIAATVLAASGLLIDFGMRVSAPQQDTLWTLAALLWFIIGVPLAAYVAPDYSVHGLGAYVLVFIIVTGCEVLLSRASPWRTRWQR